MLLSFAALLYVGSLKNGFVLDDPAAIRDNPIVHRGDPVEIFTTDYWAGFHNDRSGLYRPLTVFTFALNYRLSGTDPAPYHLVNLLFHAAAALLFYRFCLRCTRSPDLSWWAGLIFAAHPVQTEAVTALTGRADLMAALFGFFALERHLKGRETGKNSRFPASALWLGAALLSKESAIVFPALLAWTDLFQYRTFPEKCYRKRLSHLAFPHLLYAGVLLVYLLVRWRVLGGLVVPEINPLDNPLVLLDWPLRLLNAIEVLFRYLGLMILPAHLSADYSFNAIPLVRQLWSVDLVLVFFGLLSLFGLLWITWRQGGWTAFGSIWIFLALAPVANIFLLIGTIMAERLLYLPLAGFALFFASTWIRFLPLSSVRYLFGGCLLILYTSSTIARVSQWRDEYSLFRHTVQIQPRSARAWRILGRAALEHGDAQTGLFALHRALDIFPDYYEVYGDLGRFYFDRGEYERALQYFESGLRLRNDYPPFWLNQGIALYHLGDRIGAKKALERAIALDPKYAMAWYNLGVILLEEGAWKKAEESFEKVLSLEPGHQDARFNLESLRTAKHPPSRSH